MMTIYQRMADVFERAGLPGFLLAWQKTDECPKIPPKYCTYTVTLEDDALCGDDTELIHRTDLTVHLWGTTDVSEEKESLLYVLRGDGFFVSRMRDMDDVRAGDYQYHKRIDITYFEEV